MFFASELVNAGALVPAPLRSAIIIRSAGYERNFAQRSGEAVLAVVAGKSGISAEDGRTMAAVFGKLLGEGRIAGRKARVIKVTHEPGKTGEQLRTERAEIVYLSQGLEGLAKELPSQEGGISRIMVCADGGGVEVGCTLGVELDGERPRLVVNLKQANAAGLRFPPEFLRLARIVR